MTTSISSEAQKNYVMDKQMDGVIEQMLSYHNKEKNDSEYAKIQQKKSQNLKK